MSGWYPQGTTHGTPTAGDVVAVDATDLRYRPWRIASITEHPEGVTDHPDVRWVIVLREPDAPDLAGSDLHHLEFKRLGDSIWKLKDRYPLCSCCGDLMPCRHEMEDRTVDNAAARMRRYETAGVCPACQEAVTNRQQSIRFDTNLYAMLGPSPVFHLRYKCRSEAIRYDEALAKHEGRQPRLSCAGMVTRHAWSEWDSCTNPTCPGLDVQHRGGYNGYCLHRPCGICENHATTTTESETRP